MDPKQLFLSFHGRIDRAKWWAGQIILAIVLGLIFYFSFSLRATIGDIIVSATTLILLYPGYVLSAKRFQDRDKPGTTALYGYIPLAIVALFNAFHLTGAPEQPNAVGWNAIVIAVAIGVWFLVELGMLKGTIGPNRFGTDPSTKR